MRPERLSPTRFRGCRSGYVPPAATQFPLLHCSPLAHVLPQPPQLLESLSVLTHWPPHSEVPPVQLRSQFPPEQVSPEPQLLPQEPQLLRSESVLTHWPPHSEVPPVQLRTQSPAVQS